MSSASQSGVDANPGSGTRLTRQQRKEQTQRAILRAAIDVFAELGFEAASMGAIANRARMKKALVQYHFETKDNLWKEAMLMLWQQLENAFPRYLQNMDASRDRDSIRDVFRQIIRFVQDHPAWAGIIFRESATRGQRLDWLVENCLKRNVADGIQFIKLAQDHGTLPKADPLYQLHIISGALIYILLVSPMTERATGVDMTSDTGIEILLDTFMNMLQVPQQS